MTNSVHFRPGAFVKVISSPFADWGVGKLVEVSSNSIAKIQYFDQPGYVQQIEAPLNQVKRTNLPAQTRIYRKGVGGRWQIGRVLEDDQDVLFVQFPNGETDNVEASQLQVRWDRPLFDPLTLLATESTETLFLADARSTFVQAVARQYHSSAGVGAILCSSIDLVDYQFDVIRRVLTDPIQRYLLADEVGLGKTIEAAVILRQYFIDDLSARAVVVVPHALVYQWRRELTIRFGLAAALDESLHVVAHGDLDRLSAVIADAGMLVVDEAHHLSKQSTPEQCQLYELMRTHSRRVRRLLLLSATPVLGNAEEFLRVLHLLDPVVFPLDDLDGFKRRIASRQVVAEVVSTLQPENVWGLGPDLDRLLETYEDDPLLEAKVGVLKNVLEKFPDEENPEFLAALEDLKTHLVESYRLHRRLLRNRRAAVSWATPRRSGLRPVIFRSTLAENWRDRLEQLRLAVTGFDQLPPTVAQALMAAVVHPCGGQSLSLILNASLDDPDLLAQAEAVDHAARRLLVAADRVTAACRQIKMILDTPEVQVVVFCDRPEDADRVANALARDVGDRVVRHAPVEMDSDGEVTAPLWEQFLTAPDLVRILVCDSRAEEGVNLHGGRKVAFHFDLPASPNRIEQRLGRLDRYGTGDPIPSYVLLDEANPDEAAWATLLEQGWGVFSRSVASLQYLIESTSAELAQDWISCGISALIEHAARLGGPDGWVQQEIQQLNHQDSLDALANREIPGMEALEDADSDWANWRSAFLGLAVKALGFHLRIDGDRGALTVADIPLRLGYAYQGGMSPTLLPLTGFLKHFLATVDQDIAGGNARFPHTHRFAFKRRTATSRRGLSQGIHLLRIGDPLIASLEQFCETDDRGRAFAVWRVDRQYEVNDPSGADLYFRFDFVVRPSVSASESVGLSDNTDDGERIKRLTLARKASTFLPPLAIRIWVHGSGTVEAVPANLLTAEYCDIWKGTRRDFNLNVRRWRALPANIKSTWMRDWGQLCTTQCEISRAAVQASSAYLEHIQAAMVACALERRLRRSQGEARASRLNGPARQQELDELRQAEEMYAALEAVIGHPCLELDVVGAMFLASESPFEE
jgi:ATP-dependent helicase HepA